MKLKYNKGFMISPETETNNINQLENLKVDIEKNIGVNVSSMVDTFNHVVDEESEKTFCNISLMEFIFDVLICEYEEYKNLKYSFCINKKINKLAVMFYGI